MKWPGRGKRPWHRSGEETAAVILHSLLRLGNKSWEFGADLVHLGTA